MGDSQDGLTLLPLFSGSEEEGSASPKAAHSPCSGPGGGWARYLLLVQGQVQECACAQGLHVPGLGPQHRVEVEHGGLPLAQERVASGAGEQGLACLTPWRKGMWHQDIHRPQTGTGGHSASAFIQYLLRPSWCPGRGPKGAPAVGPPRELTDHWAPRHTGSSLAAGHGEPAQEEWHLGGPGEVRRGF